MLTLLHPLTNFEIQKYYQNKSRFNVAYSISNLSKRKDGTYVINVEKYRSLCTHWIALYMNSVNPTSFCVLCNYFCVQHTSELNKFEKNFKNSYVIKLL